MSKDKVKDKDEKDTKKSTLADRMDWPAGSVTLLNQKETDQLMADRKAYWEKRRAEEAEAGKLKLRKIKANENS